jgi:hypothetical protein
MYTTDDETSNVKRIFIKDVNVLNEKCDQNTVSIVDELTNGTNTTNTTNTNEKKIVINELTNGTKQIKKKEKEKKMRVETKTWGLNNDDLSFETQLQLLETIFNKKKKNENKDKNETNEKINDKHIAMITSHIKAKICGYKQQDILKNKFLEEEFVSYNDVIDLLHNSQMKCHYCSCETYLLYEVVRENKQWSLDRINNEIGHNRNNLLIACLECNLKRRRTNKDAFFFTKNLQIVRLD